VSAESEILARASRVQEIADPPRSRDEILTEIAEVVEEIERRWPDGEPADVSESTWFNLRHVRLIHLQWDLEDAPAASGPSTSLTVIRGGRDA